MLERRGSGRIRLHCAGGVVNLARRRKERYLAIPTIRNALLCLNTTASQQLPGSTDLFPTMHHSILPASALTPFR